MGVVTKGLVVWAALAAPVAFAATVGYEDCVDLKPRESKKIDSNYGSLYAQYTLRRLPNVRLPANYPAKDPVDGKVLWIMKGFPVARYEITINPVFNNPSKKFLEGLHQCVQRWNPFLRGPGGEYLSIRFYDENPAVIEPPKIKVDWVSDEEDRGNSLDWKRSWGASESGCATAMHEMFHWMGLVDEYRESARGTVVTADGKVEEVADISEVAPKSKNGEKKGIFLKYDCRATGPIDSIMAHQDEASGNVQPTFFFGLQSDPTRPSLLFGGQFRALTKPGCVDVNPTYYACAKFAYRTSIGHYGSGCEDDLPVCRKKNWVDAPLFTGW